MKLKIITKRFVEQLYGVKPIAVGKPYKVSSKNRKGKRRIFEYVIESGRGFKICKIIYSRYLVEKRLGYRLDRNIFVHHKDENTLNDSDDNLEPITLCEHTRLHKPQQIFKLPNKMKFICPWCGNKIIIKGSYWLTRTFHNRKRGSAGPFCSTYCQQKYYWHLRKGGKPIRPNISRFEKYRIRKDRKMKS